jgi:hypothetical protein
MGKSYAKESTGVVATPAAQTKLLIGLRELSEGHFVSLFSCNLFTAEGRSSFVKHWNRLDFTENFEWSEHNAEECGELNQFQSFLRFKKALDNVNTVMVSAIEGNNRMSLMRSSYSQPLKEKCTQRVQSMKMNLTRRRD